jgi:hypothetical protein
MIFDVSKSVDQHHPITRCAVAPAPLPMRVAMSSHLRAPTTQPRLMFSSLQTRASTLASGCLALTRSRQLDPHTGNGAFPAFGIFKYLYYPLEDIQIPVSFSPHITYPRHLRNAPAPSLTGHITYRSTSYRLTLYYTTYINRPVQSSPAQH